MSAGRERGQASKQTIENEQCGSNPPKGMPQANSHSTWILASQGGFLWQFANCGRRYATAGLAVSTKLAIPAALMHTRSLYDDLREGARAGDGRPEFVDDQPQFGILDCSDRLSDHQRPPLPNHAPPGHLSSLKTFPTSSAHTCRRHVVNYPLPSVAAASTTRLSRVTALSPPPCSSSPPPWPPSPPSRPPDQAVLPHRPLRRAPRRHRLARPFKTRFSAVAAASPPRRRRLAPPSPLLHPAVAERRQRPQCRFLR